MFNDYFSPFKKLFNNDKFVTREEFEVQKAILARYKHKLAELEQKLADKLQDLNPDQKTTTTSTSTTTSK